MRSIVCIITVVEAEVVRKLSSDHPLLHKGLDAVGVPLRRLHAHHRRLRAHLAEVEVCRHVGADVLVGVVGEVREALDPCVEEGLEVGAGSLGSGLQPSDFCAREP